MNTTLTTPKDRIYVLAGNQMQADYAINSLRRKYHFDTLNAFCTLTDENRIRGHRDIKVVIHGNPHNRPSYPAIMFQLKMAKAKFFYLSRYRSQAEQFIYSQGIDLDWINENDPDLSIMELDFPVIPHERM